MPSQSIRWCPLMLLLEQHSTRGQPRPTVSHPNSVCTCQLPQSHEELGTETARRTFPPPETAAPTKLNQSRRAMTRSVALGTVPNSPASFLLPSRQPVTYHIPATVFDAVKTANVTKGHLSKCIELLQRGPPTGE